MKKEKENLQVEQKIVDCANLAMSVTELLRGYNIALIDSDSGTGVVEILSSEKLEQHIENAIAELTDGDFASFADNFIECAYDEFTGRMITPGCKGTWWDPPEDPEYDIPNEEELKEVFIDLLCDEVNKILEKKNILLDDSGEKLLKDTVMDEYCYSNWCIPSDDEIWRHYGFDC